MSESERRESSLVELHEDEVADDMDSEKPKPHSPTEPLPVPPSVHPSGISVQSHKLWIGNLDKRLTEQNILRFTAPFGEIVSFKYLLHTAGVEKGEPRGYCFIEFSTREFCDPHSVMVHAVQEADKARTSLSGKKALGKKLIVDWARPDVHNKKSGTVSETWDASSVSATLNSGASTSAKIAALEAKLKEMDRKSVGSNGTGEKTLTTSYYNQARVLRKHGGILKIHRPQKPYNRTELFRKAR